MSNYYEIHGQRTDKKSDTWSVEDGEDMDITSVKEARKILRCMPKGKRYQLVKYRLTHYVLETIEP